MNDKTLEQLEDDYWVKSPEFNSSNIALKCYELRKKQITDFSIEDLRVMISQSIGLKFLIPEAILKLKDNLFAEGDFYEGDLLKSILTCDKLFWESNPSLKEEILQLIETNIHKIKEHDIMDSIKSELLQSYEAFR